ncbi:MAG: nitrate/nitrite transporter [Pseudomonas sp.]|uniref:MFS transporter n=1 Tax=Pseudomonas sp. TaxID=306 RepID=UPI0033919E53
MITLRVQRGLVLGMSTLAFTVCFMIWMMFAVLGVPIKELLQLNETQFGLLAATPVLTGSLVRLPLGMLTDRFGGRIVFFLLMLVCVLPIYLISQATAYWHFLLLGLFVGLAGGSFSVGIAYVAKWFDKQNQGFAMGIFGAGNAGAALTKFFAPAIIAAASWQMVPKVFSAIMFITALLFWFCTAENKAHRVTSSVSLAEQLRTLKDPAIWRYCQYYSIVFGGYVALALWMTKYYVQEYGFNLQSAALLAACFSLPGGVLRAVGGWMSDRWGAQSVTWWVLWVSWVCLFLLSYPQTELSIQTVSGPKQFSIGLNAYAFTALLFVMGIAFAFGKASVFKYIANDYPQNMGAVSGIVGLAGGLGGFVLPILFGALVDLTGVRSSCFMLMYGVVWVSLIWMYLSEIRKTPVMGAPPVATRAGLIPVSKGV